MALLSQESPRGIRKGNTLAILRRDTACDDLKWAHPTPHIEIQDFRILLAFPILQKLWSDR